MWSIPVALMQKNRTVLNLASVPSALVNNLARINTGKVIKLYTEHGVHTKDVIVLILCFIILSLRYGSYYAEFKFLRLKLLFMSRD